METLIGVQPLIEIIELTLQTAYLKPYEPVSLLLIAKPESCKTRTLFSNCNHNFIYYTNEITAKMLIDNVLTVAHEKKKLKFLVIPDLLNCIEKQKTSQQQFLNLIKSMMDEGINSIQTFYKIIESSNVIC